MAYLAEDQQVWMARALGAAAGACLSVIYMLPKGYREAAIRFMTGLVAGLIFGGPAGLFLSEKLGLAGQLSVFEVALSGSAAISLTAWWGLGVLKRMAERWGR